LFPAGRPDGNRAVVAWDDVDGSVFDKAANNSGGQWLQRLGHANAQDIAIDWAQLQWVLAVKPPGNLRRAQTGGEDRDVRRINLDTRTGAQSHALMRGRLRDSRDGLAHVLCSPGKDGIEERAGEKARVKLVVAVDGRGFRNPR